ncbi:MAG TPA: riboflavin synthase [Acidimicrobiales bacterium]|nr:riboflavin synthase [Acidimicrobiales bacterium]
MFTGLVEEVGTVAGRRGGRLRIAATRVLEGTTVGSSVAVDGCCLTAVELGDGWWEADLSDETLSCTTLGGRPIGEPVNLERPLRLADRLGGHLVQGHVDAVGQVLRPAPDLRVGVSGDLARYLVPKGAVAVDGVSLTVVEAGGDDFTVAVVPHTAEVTTLGRRRAGDRVNLEFDVVAKYVERLMAAGMEARS